MSVLWVGYVLALALVSVRCCEVLFFFFNDTATTEIYTLSLHDALPIYLVVVLLSAICRNTSRLVSYLAALRTRGLMRRTEIGRAHV